jgi:hypothetical protein
VQEYLQYDEQPMRLVLLGWADAPFMVGLLRELDGGSAALPHGSEVVCINTHVAHEDIDPVLYAVQAQHLKVGWPVSRERDRHAWCRQALSMVSACVFAAIAYTTLDLLVEGQSVCSQFSLQRFHCNRSCCVLVLHNVVKTVQVSNCVRVWDVAGAAAGDPRVLRPPAALTAGAGSGLWAGSGGYGAVR